jgi:hypothetical protein
MLIISKEFQMKNSLSIGKKMLLMGAIITVGLCILGGNSYLTTNRVRQATSQTMLRNQQIEIVRDIQQHQLALMVDAMDSIVDKDEGKIQADRMASINKNVILTTDSQNWISWPIMTAKKNWRSALDRNSKSWQKAFKPILFVS